MGGRGVRVGAEDEVVSCRRGVHVHVNSPHLTLSGALGTTMCGQRVISVNVAHQKPSAGNSPRQHATASVPTWNRVSPIQQNVGILVCIYRCDGGPEDQNSGTLTDRQPVGVKMREEHVVGRS